MPEIIGEIPMTNAGRILETLDCRRHEAVSAGNLFYPSVIRKQVKQIKRLIRRGLFFTKTIQDLVDLVDFCGNDEFYGHAILSKVLVYVLSSLRKKASPVRFEMCWLIMYSPTTVKHYLSTCNVDRVSIRGVRLPQVLLDWLVKHIYRKFDVSYTCNRLLSVTKADSLLELVRRTAWAFDDDEAARNTLLMDLVYLCLISLYYQSVFGNLSFTLQVGGEDKILDCLSVLLRTVPVVCSRTIYATGTRLHPMWNTRKMLCKVLRKLKVWREGLDFYPGRVPTLKHLTRCQIRSRLNCNWALPDGVYKLNLPKFLELYLDLHF